MTSWRYINLGSELGLNKTTSKYLGGALMLLALLLSPLGVGIENFLNVFLTELIVKYISITYMSVFILTYTLIPVILFLLGAMIYPHNTGQLVDSKVHAIKRVLYTLATSPYFWLVLLVLSYYWAFIR